MSPKKAALLLLAAVWLLPSGDSAARPCAPCVGEGGPQLDMAAWSVDDTYRGCVPAMEHRLAALLRLELASNKNLREAWAKAKEEWMRLKKIPVFTPNMQSLCSVAVWAYTLENPPLYREFNNATRLGWVDGSRSYARYPFKALHFLLSQAPRAIWGIQPSCSTVYRGTKIDFSVGRVFRFGHFTSTSRSEAAAANFGQRTFFQLVTCTGYALRGLSHIPSEQEVLVPPYELFRLQKIKRNGAAKTVQAKSVAVCSNHNCALTGHGDPYVPKCPAHQVLHL
ncbi:ecto-ADP-ribosyltransferase 5-like [Pelodiscus sinensis]|uniref:ecto-ADP-ribosyltransferase 5-like n=1 Tax=Pelodiscus sinensis TaxID=13735 RepID=UPI003F6C0821